MTQYRIESAYLRVNGVGGVGQRAVHADTSIITDERKFRSAERQTQYQTKNVPAIYSVF